MNTKLMATLILGLVFQLAQVLPGAIVSNTSRATTESCACCPDVQSCDCAENGDPEQQAPSPALPESGRPLKVPAAGADETPAPTHPKLAIEAAAKKAACPPLGPIHGYTGIRLSVAFCSFVI
jgi:hypothetical protein